MAHYIFLYNTSICSSLLVLPNPRKGLQEKSKLDQKITLFTLWCPLFTWIFFTRFRKVSDQAHISITPDSHGQREETQETPFEDEEERGYRMLLFPWQMPKLCERIYIFIRFACCRPPKRLALYHYQHSLLKGFFLPGEFYHWRKIKIPTLPSTPKRSLHNLNAYWKLSLINKSLIKKSCINTLAPVSYHLFIVPGCYPYVHLHLSAILI